jgi:hypothetical protein
LSGGYDVYSTSARPLHCIASTMSAPVIMRPKLNHPYLGAAGRAFSSTVPTNHSTAISKKMMKKMSMFMP